MSPRDVGTGAHAYGGRVDVDRLPLSRAVVDRAAHRRLDPDLFERAWADPSASVVLVHGASLAIRDDGDGVRLDLRPASSIGSGQRSAEGGLWLFLGDEDGPRLAFVPPEEAAPVDIEGVATGAGLGPVTWGTLREVGHLLDDRDAGLATIAVGLAAWHARHPRCPRCGGPTEAVQGGWVRRCVDDGSDHYPRTDPAVIMAVTDADERLLLAHAPHWPERRFSTLAGYVEPGESLEAAVRREVAEETSVVVGEVAYRGSQPWPFPASLMLAFVARATTTTVQVDGVEVTEARWFTRPELRDAVSSGQVLLPMRTSVARALIEDWAGAPFEDD